jgi:hypothetical protein
MPLYTSLHSLLNVFVQIANKMGLQKKMFVSYVFIEYLKPESNSTLVTTIKLKAEE